MEIYLSARHRKMAALKLPTPHQLYGGSCKLLCQFQPTEYRRENGIEKVEGTQHENIVYSEILMPQISQLYLFWYRFEPKPLKMCLPSAAMQSGTPVCSGRRPPIHIMLLPYLRGELLGPDRTPGTWRRAICAVAFKLLDAERAVRRREARVPTL